MLKCKIEALINSKGEGDHWDFKEKTHENNAASLHHILSLAKSLDKGERYLIFGVADPNDGCTIKGLSNGEVNQKNQTDLLILLGRRSLQLTSNH